MMTKAYTYGNCHFDQKYLLESMPVEMSVFYSIFGERIDYTVCVCVCDRVPTNKYHI